MADLGQQIRHSMATNLKGLLRFSGRQASGEFWPYAAIVILIGMIIAGTGFMGPFVDAMRQMQQFALEHPEQATVTSGPGHYSIEIRGDAPRFLDARAALLSMAPGATFIVVLLAASATRRLHDTGLTGLIGLLPIATAVVAGKTMIEAFDRPLRETVESGLFMRGFLFNGLYLASLLLLLVLLCRDGKPDENRYGPPPNNSS